jgi:hypothetical protein
MTSLTAVQVAKGKMGMGAWSSCGEADLLLMAVSCSRTWGKSSHAGTLQCSARLSKQYCRHQDFHITYKNKKLQICRECIVQAPHLSEHTPGCLFPAMVILPIPCFWCTSGRTSFSFSRAAPRIAQMAGPDSVSSPKGGAVHEEDVPLLLLIESTLTGVSEQQQQQQHNQHDRMRSSRSSSRKTGKKYEPSSTSSTDSSCC